MTRAAAAAALLLATLAAAAAPPAFAVGVLRRDGVIIPFATFDGRTWSARWPAPAPNPTIPINVTSVPRRWWGAAGPRDTWQVWTDTRSSEVRVTQLDAVDVHCVRQIGLRTDYRPDAPPPPWTEQPYPKDGVAVSPPQPIERIAILTALAPQLASIGSALRDAFNAAERRSIAGSRIAFDRDTRERNDPNIEAAYALGVDPRFFYVESSRIYQRLGGDDCVTAFGYGWFVRHGSVYTPLDMTVDLLPCTKYGASYMYPFGAITVAGRTYWFAQFSGWDDERFVVLEIKPKSVVPVVNAWEGGC